MCSCSPSKTEAQAAAPAEAIVFSVPDMTCGHCVRAITEAFAKKLPGTAVEIDLPTKTVRVAAPAELAVAILADAGYDADRI